MLKELFERRVEVVAVDIESFVNEGLGHSSFPTTSAAFRPSTSTACHSTTPRPTWLR